MTNPDHSPAEVLEDLRVHQIELELQNEELRRIQVELDAAQALYFDLYDLAPVGYFTIGEGGQIVHANLTLTNLLGLSRDSLVHRRFSQFLYADDQDAFYRARKQVLAEHKPVVFEVRLLTAHRSVMWVQMSMTWAPVDPATQLRVSVTDITSHRTIEDALRLSAATLESVSQGVITTGPDFLVLTVNRAFVEITGHRQEDLKGRNCRVLQGPLTDNQEIAAIRAALKSHSSYHGELLNYRRDGSTFWNDLTLTPVLGNDAVATHYVGVIRDVSERRAAEEVAVALQAQLLQSQKMESLGLLAGGVAHDMNNILAAISAVASVQLHTLTGNDSATRAFSTIETAVRRGGEMVSSLLNFTRKDLTERHPVDWNALVSEQMTLLAHTTLAQVTIKTQLAKPLAAVDGDAGSLGLALMNLCVNAVDAMRGSPRPQILTIATRTSGTQVIVEVTDNGSGMSPEVQRKALDPFFTTKARGKGTGLGLSMVYSVVKAHGGQIEIDSQPALGTTVRLVFPTSNAPASPLPAAVAPTATCPEVGTVLLVDDDDLVRDSFCELLKALAVTVTSVNSGEAALKVLDDDSAFGLVILDMNMPGMGGNAALKAIRHKYPEQAVLVTTGLADQSVLDLVATTPRTQLMTKPFDLRTLRDFLAQHCSH